MVASRRIQSISMADSGAAERFAEGVAMDMASGASGSGIAADIHFLHQRDSSLEGRFTSGECPIMLTSSGFYGNVKANAKFEFAAAPMPYYPDVAGALAGARRRNQSKRPMLQLMPVVH